MQASQIVKDTASALYKKTVDLKWTLN